MDRDDDIEMHRIILHLLDGKESTEKMCKYVIDLMRELSDLKKDSPGMTPGKYMIYTDIWGKCMLFCLLVWRNDHQRYPAFAFPPLRDCARCGRCLQDDEGGVPCNPDHASIEFDENCVPIAKKFWKSRFCPNCGAKMDGGICNADRGCF